MELLEIGSDYFLKIDERTRNITWAFEESDIDEFRSKMELIFSIDNWYNQQVTSEEAIKDFIDNVATPIYLKNHFSQETETFLNSVVADAWQTRIENMSKLKMYILVRSDIGSGHQTNCVAHAAATAILKWKDDDTFENWKKHSFRKVTCSVTRGQFEEAKQYSDNLIISEDILNDTEVAMAFKPREDWPEFFKKLRLLG